MLKRFLTLSLTLVLLLGLNACDSEPPELMKASKQFESDEIRDKHIAYMRKNHMDALKHKRDETMNKGIRTEKNSLNACIDCHVPEIHNGEVLRHTDQEHFCTTCHTYVAAKLDCFECHVDHPIKLKDKIKSAGLLTKHTNVALNNMENLNYESIKLSTLDNKELMALAFKFSDKGHSQIQASRGVIETTKERSDADPKGEVKPNKSGGGSLLVVKNPQSTVLDSNISIKSTQGQKTEEMTSE